MPLVPAVLEAVAQAPAQEAMDALVNAAASYAAETGVDRETLLEGVGRTFDWYAQNREQRH
jgi:hypothetical protein